MVQFILTEKNSFINKWEMVTFGGFFFLKNIKFDVIGMKDIASRRIVN